MLDKPVPIMIYPPGWLTASLGEWLVGLDSFGNFLLLGFSLLVFVGEFDPGSGRTLAACLTHASRAERPFGVLERRTGE